MLTHEDKAGGTVEPLCGLGEGNFGQGMPQLGVKHLQNKRKMVRGDQC